MGDKVMTALKIDVFGKDHPKHAGNSIRNIPLVKKDNNGAKDTFLKNL